MVRLAPFAYHFVHLFHHILPEVVSNMAAVHVVEIQRVHQFAIAWKPQIERGFSNEPSTNLALPDSANPLRHAALATPLARLPDVNAVPYIEDQGRQNYANFLKRKAPRAFAISSAGGYGWSSGGNGKDTADHALANCNARSSVPCKLYAVDDKIVWDDK